MSEIALEPVDVIVRTKKGKTEIVRFRRGDSEYIVTKFIASWVEHAGDNVVTHYHLICQKQNISCELSHNHILNVWTLVQIDDIIPNKKRKGS
jgi:hypothetical protein